MNYKWCNWLDMYNASRHHTSFKAKGRLLFVNVAFRRPIFVSLSLTGQVSLCLRDTDGKRFRVTAGGRRSLLGAGGSSVLSGVWGAISVLWLRAGCRANCSTRVSGSGRKRWAATTLESSETPSMATSSALWQNFWQNINEAHTSGGYCGRDKLQAELAKHYYNI